MSRVNEELANYIQSNNVGILLKAPYSAKQESAFVTLNLLFGCEDYFVVYDNFIFTYCYEFIAPAKVTLLVLIHAE